MTRPQWEVADIVRDHAPAWRHAHRLNTRQLKALSAIERCRSSAMGGHALRCEPCHDDHIAYNSCRNRHCPKCQASAAKRWLESRQAELLPVAYYHVVFTLPAIIARIAFQNPTVIYGLLFSVTAQTLLTIAADPKHLGAKIGFTAVLHTWGSALTHHPHLHCVVPGGGLNPDGHWKPCKPGFFLPVKVLSRLFRRLFMERLVALHPQLQFFGTLKQLENKPAFRDYLAPAYTVDWVVYAKKPFAGPKAVLTYLSRYTHRVAISNRRITHYDKDSVTFTWKDYRANAKRRAKTMTLSADEFLRRFLIHILPLRFHRIRHYGLLANHQRKQHLSRLRQLLCTDRPSTNIQQEPTEPSIKLNHPLPIFVCRLCGKPMIILATLLPLYPARAPP